jgi:hypothetical protein
MSSKIFSMAMVFQREKRYNIRVGRSKMAQKRKTPEDFWREYEEKTGERVLARALGQYVSGWDEFGDLSAPPYGGSPLWGLIIATSGGFRFHHFPQVNWLSAIMRSGSADDPPAEKTIFIPREKLISAELRKETKWYRKIFSQDVPRLLIRYRAESGTEKELVLNAEYKPEGLAEALITNEKLEMSN